MGCLVWVWLIFFRSSPLWAEGIVFFVGAYFFELVIRSVFLRFILCDGSSCFETVLRWNAKAEGWTRRAGKDFCRECSAEVSA